MSNTTTQPKHTEGELKSLDRTYNIIGSSPDERTWQTLVLCNKQTAFLAIGATEEESKANAQRIVKAGNLLTRIENILYTKNSTFFSSEERSLLKELLKQEEQEEQEEQK